MPDLARVELVSNQTRSRFEYALRLAEHLVEDVNEWRKTHPLDAEMEVDADRLGWTVRVTRFDPAPPLVEWGLRFGEIAHHFRSVLNTMLTRIAAEERLPPNKQRQFPIVLDPRRWHHKKTGEYRRVQVTVRVPGRNLTVRVL